MLFLGTFVLVAGVVAVLVAVLVLVAAGGWGPESTATSTATSSHQHEHLKEGHETQPCFVRAFSVENRAGL